MANLRLDLPVLLPEAPDAKDACVRRVEELLQQHDGVLSTHVLDSAAGSKLCIHFDPDRLTIERVEQMARLVGMSVHERYGHGVWPLRLVAGEDAGRRLEDQVLDLDGVIAVSANQAAQSIFVEFERARFVPASLEILLGSLGAAVGPTTSWYARNRELAWSLTAASLLAAGLVISRTVGLGWASLVAYALSYVFGAFDLLRHTVTGIRKGRVAFDIDLLMLLAAIGAGVLGEYAEGAFLLTLFSLAHALEHYALGRARASIRALAELAPTMAWVERGGRVEEVGIETVRVGERVLVRPADRVPFDGRIVRGRSALNEAPITGESMPVDKTEGDSVFAGAINGEGALTIETTTAVGDRALDRVIKLVEEAQTQKAPTQMFTDRFERVFVPVVLVADVLLIALPPLLGVWDWSTSLYRAMALLVAASPCALALGTPATVLAGVAQAARRGVLIKGGMHLENLGTVRAIALDKTGTLTTGRPEVTDILALTGVDARELLSLAAAVERQSAHPLAAAVVRKAVTDNVPEMSASDVVSVTGRGIRALVSGQLVEIGNPRYFEDSSAVLPSEIGDRVRALQERGYSVMIVRRAEQWLGVVGLADRPRDAVREVLQRLRADGIRHIVMLTGDHQGVGAAIGREVGVDQVKGELLPDDKVTAIKALLSEYGRVAMVGDGVNDAPALAHATVGIAMGAAGTATALETADVALMADDLSRLPFAVGLSRQARAIIRQNLLVSMSVIAALAITAVTGVAGIGVAVAIHEGSTLLVIANALRLLMYEDGSRS